MEDHIVSQAFEDAVALIEQAKTTGATSLSFDDIRFRRLQNLPIDISSLDDLTALDLTDTQISDLSALSPLGKLQVLNLRQTRVSDLRPLSKLESLAYLDLAGTDVSDLTPIANLTVLEYLDVSDTAVEDPRPIQMVAQMAAANRDTGAVVLAGIPALALDPQLAEIAEIKRAHDRAHKLSDYLSEISSSWPPERTDVTETVQDISADVSRIQSGQKELTALFESLDRMGRAIREQIDSAQANAVDERNKAAAEISDLSENMVKRYETLEHNLQSEMEAAINAYVGAQAIKGPVTLWTDKQTEHQARAESSMKRFYLGLAGTGGVVVALMALVAFFPQQIAELLSPVGCTAATPEHCDGFSFKGMALVAGALTIFTLLLWVTRLQMKVYLSERHLALDARERQAFAQSYVGLLGEGDTTEEAKEQRALVYAALFRPTSDGIIKDEGGIDPSVAAAMSKFLAGRP